MNCQCKYCITDAQSVHSLGAKLCMKIDEQGAECARLRAENNRLRVDNLIKGQDSSVSLNASIFLAENLTIAKALLREAYKEMSRPKRPNKDLLKRIDAALEEKE